jgi:hypothetical protein
LGRDRRRMIEECKVLVVSETPKLTIKNIWDYLKNKEIDSNTNYFLAKRFGISKRFARIAVEKYLEWSNSL